jgi:hypothetical protein
MAKNILETAHGTEAEAESSCAPESVCSVGIIPADGPATVPAVVASAANLAAIAAAALRFAAIWSCRLGGRAEGGGGAVVGGANGLNAKSGGELDRTTAKPGGGNGGVPNAPIFGGGKGGVLSIGGEKGGSDGAVPDGPPDAGKGIVADAKKPSPRTGGRSSSSCIIGPSPTTMA